MHYIELSENIASFSFPLLVQMDFISFSYLIAVARTSSTMSNRSGKSRHPCFILNLRGKTLSFLLSSIMLVVGFVMLRYIPHTHLLRFFFFFFISCMDIEFCQMLFSIYCNDHMIFVHFFNAVYQFN